MSADQIVKLPKSSDHTTYEQLGYVESYDAVIDKPYALLVYKETKTSSGKWVVRVASANTAGTVFDPESTALKNALRKAHAHDEAFLVWGFNLKPKDSDADARLVENRLFYDESGAPSKLEVHLITRKANGSAMPEQVATVPWPA